MFTELTIDEIEADEIRTFVYTESNVRWVYIAMDRASRLIIHFHIGDRNAKDTKIFLSGLCRKLASKSQVATDCWHSYMNAVERTPYGRIDSAVREIQLLRSEAMGEHLGRAITNRIETTNGTVRQHVARLTRKSRCFSKKEEGLYSHLTLFFFYYNFIKKNKAVKIQPAVAAGLTDEANWMEKILEYDMIFSENMRGADPKCYGNVGKKAVIKSIGQTEKEDFLQQITGVQFVKKDAPRTLETTAAKVIII